MKTFWRETKSGAHLMLELDNGDLTRVGFIISTPSSIDAVAQTRGYAPERSQNGFPTIEAARLFVESFSPWLEFGGAGDLLVEPGVRPRV